MGSSVYNLPTGHAFPDDESVMRRALAVAMRGLGHVEPNPMVGAVIVDDQRRLIAEGWHEAFGSDHAELRAIRTASSTVGHRLFVTLEPCSHHGKTPPCSDAVIAAGIRNVFIGCRDPASHTASQGIAALEAAGISVECGLCQEDAEDLIAPFKMLQRHGRPWVHAKWAMTLDGKIASRTGHSQWISGEESRAVVHRLRGRMDAIITGAGTVRLDDPLLTARPPGPRTAARIVMDADGNSLQSRTQLVTSRDLAPVIACIADSQPEETLSRLQSLGIDVLRLPELKTGRLCVSSLLPELGQRQMTNVLVESGGEILGSFFDAELIDEIHAFIAPKLVGGRESPSPIGGRGLDRVPQMASLRNVQLRHFGGDALIEGRVPR